MSEHKYQQMIWLDNSRIIAVLAVVFLHVSAYVVTKSNFGSEYWWFGNIYDSLVRWCVPVFVMISGALLLCPSKTEDVFTFYNKRLSRVLIPLIFWSAFYLVLDYFKMVLKSSPHLDDYYFVRKILSGKPHEHLWFLYMIINLYLFTPFFRKIILKSTNNEILILILVSFLLSSINCAYQNIFSEGSGLFINWFLSFVPYFFLGYLIRSSAMVSRANLLCIFFLSVLLTSIGNYFFSLKNSVISGKYFYEYLSVTVIPMSITVMLLLKKTQPILSIAKTKSLSNLTFGIYLIHPFFLETINYAGFGSINFYPLISVPLISLIVFLVSLFSVWFISMIPYLRCII